MKAVRRTEPGHIEVQDVPEPTAPGDDDVLVSMAYAAVNPFDAQVLRGQLGDPGLVLTLGAEGSGIVDGRPVQVSGGGLGVARDGTFAPVVVAPRSAVRFLPDGADLALAATVGIAGKTAWRAVHQLARVGEADVVLILGASGGVGTFAAQLARSTGARVLAHTGSEDKAGRLRELGLETIVAEGAQSLPGLVASAGITVVLDPLGGDYVSTLLGVLSPSARVVTYGVLAGASTELNLATLYAKGIHVIGTSGGTTPPDESAAALAGAAEALRQGTVVVDVEVLPLGEAPAAFQLLADREVQGKLLLGMQPVTEGEEV